jgi:murein DD-endopeptidase MepM/ murein hydrolase activator NlpD
MKLAALAALASFLIAPKTFITPRGPTPPGSAALFLQPGPLARLPLDLQLESRAQQPGELVVLTFDVPDRAGPPRVRALGRDIPAYSIGPNAWRALLGIDLDVKPGTFKISVSTKDSSARVEREIVIASKAFPTRRLTVDEAFVTPPPSEQARIASDARLLEDAWRSSAAERLWSGPFVRPVPQEANSRFGTRSIFNGKPRNPHGGADFMSPSGTPVHAPNAGLVVVARNLYFSGNTVIIDHGLGLFSTLAHFSAIEVREGDRVQAGTVVGRVGATGRVTGPHLHWAVRANDARIDPIAVLVLLGNRHE